MSKESRAVQLASATPKDHKPKWYMWLAWAAIAATIIWVVFFHAGEGVIFFPLLLVLLCAGTSAWNYKVNGHIFDDRSGGY